MRSISILFLAAAAAFTQQPSAQQIYRSMVFDPTSGAGVGVDSGGGKVPGQRPPRALKPETHTQTNAGGLMFYVELIKPNGERMRVNTSRVFHTGERIQLHVQSNVNGRLYILDKEKDGTSTVLFPDKRIKDGDDRVVAGIDMVIPSATQFFELDKKVGTERLMVFLNSDSTSESAKSLVAGATLDNAATTEMAAQIPANTRGMVLREEASGPEPATYVVKTAEMKNSGPKGQILALEIALNHQ